MDKENLENILRILERFARVVKFNKENFLTPYPLFQSLAVYFPNDGIIKITEENYQEMITRVMVQIRQFTSTNSNPLLLIFMAISSPYRIQYLELIQSYLNKKDFTELLGWVWTDTEFPNQYKTETLIDLFENASKCDLMEDDELKGLEVLPDTIRVYRGTQTQKAKVKGLSWTLSKEKAKWFANRWDRGQVYTAEIDKVNIFAYFKGRNEEEIVLDPRGLKDVKKFTE